MKPGNICISSKYCTFTENCLETNFLFFFFKLFMLPVFRNAILIQVNNNKPVLRKGRGKGKREGLEREKREERGQRGGGAGEGRGRKVKQRDTLTERKNGQGTQTLYCKTAMWF